MKKNSIQLFTIMFVLSVCLSCGSKNKEEVSETNSDAATEAAAAETTKAADVAAKRARLEAARAAKAEERRLAAIEAAKTSPTYKDANGKVIYIMAEVDPSFNGGEKAMRKYLHDNLTYPETARDNGIEGTVFVDFVVEENGKVREVNATDVIGDEIEQSLKDEAVRVVSSMPAWIPGRQHGKAVDTKFSIPISFQLM
jgi:TonB family protein